MSNLGMLTLKYKVSIKSFSVYKHLLQENDVEYKYIYNIYTTINTWHKILETNLSNGKKNMILFHVFFL